MPSHKSMKNESFVPRDIIGNKFSASNFHDGTGAVDFNSFLWCSVKNKLLHAEIIYASLKICPAMS